MKFLKSGKVKDVYEASDSDLEFVFSDRISVFDRVIPSEIPFKGETLARTAAYWFQLCKDLGIKTHYIRLIGPNRMMVSKVRVIPDPDSLKGERGGYLIPLECIARYYLYGSLWDRVAEGEIDTVSLSFPRNHKAVQGERLPHPFFEVTTKLEKVDRNITELEALRISGLTKDEFDEMKAMVLRIDAEMNNQLVPRGLIHVDGKKEFAFDKDRNIMVVDTFGTADEDRFWDAAELKQGRFVERSKEFVRQYYRRTGYHDRLMRARRKGTEEPPIPALPPEMLETVSNVYIKLFEDLTGQRFR
jgi:phosphoribosylaminoimidazole-succinocarboxamide synthase